MASLFHWSTRAPLVPSYPVWQWNKARLQITKASQRQTVVNFPPGWGLPQITHSSGGEKYSSASARHMPHTLNQSRTPQARPGKKPIDFKMTIIVGLYSLESLYYLVYPSNFRDDCNRASLRFLITNLCDLVESNHQWSFSTIFFQGHHSRTLQLAPHVSNMLEAGVNSLLIIMHVSKLSVRFPSLVWNVWLINIHSHFAPRWTPHREMRVLGAAFNNGVSLLLWSGICSSLQFFHLKYPQQPVWSLKIARKNSGEPRVSVEFLFISLHIS